ncbi:MAG: S1 RNA-binding domain-containing protein [Bacillota bacterium]|nr:S1 RNA-binding domain-containing protein [Bacillota bacterium]
MEIKIDSVLPGKVSRIMPFGAFIDLGEGKSGLVHISEIADAFVKDVNDYISLGQEVQVRVLSIDQSGKVSLSLKKPLEEKAAPLPENKKESFDSSFEDKLARFMKDSNEKLVALKHYHEGKRNR